MIPHGIATFVQYSKMDLRIVFLKDAFDLPSHNLGDVTQKVSGKIQNMLRDIVV